ncbi:MAG TPA: hypothetical protein VF263_02715 [Longimicrobiaceae bacterium]
MLLMQYLASKKGKTITADDIKSFIRKEMSVDDGSKGVLEGKVDSSFKGITILQTANLATLNTAGGLRTFSASMLKQPEKDLLDAIVRAEQHLAGAGAAIARSPTRSSFGSKPISQLFKMKHLNSGETAKTVATHRANATGMFLGALPQATNTNLATGAERLLVQDIKENSDAGVYDAVYAALSKLRGNGVIQIDHVVFRTSLQLTTTTYTVVTATGTITEALTKAPIWYAMTQDDQGRYICNHFGGVAQWNTGTKKYDPPDAVNTWVELDYSKDPVLAKLASKPDCRYVLDEL